MQLFNWNSPLNSNSSLTANSYTRNSLPISVIMTTNQLKVWMHTDSIKRFLCDPQAMHVEDRTCFHNLFIFPKRRKRDLCMNACSLFQKPCTQHKPNTTVFGTLLQKIWASKQFARQLCRRCKSFPALPFPDQATKKIFYWKGERTTEENRPCIVYQMKGKLYYLRRQN